MTPEEKFTNEVWWVLQRLEYLRIRTQKDEPIEFVIECRPIHPIDEPSPAAKQSVILKLQEWKAIQIDNEEEKFNTYGGDLAYRLQTLQPKFSEVYEQYEEKVLVDNILEGARNEASSIKVGTQHRLLRDKWLDTKRILDAIYKLAPLFPNEIDFDENLYCDATKGKLEFYKRNYGKMIFVDPKNLQPKQQKLFESTLNYLHNIGVISHFDHEYKGMIRSSAPWRKFLAGNILLKKENLPKFKEYHNKLFELVNFIEEDGRMRFPELYGKTKETIEGKKSKTKKENNKLKVTTKTGNLILNKKTGAVQLNTTSNCLNPSGQEFKILLKIMTNPEYQATYESLLDKAVSKTNKRELSFVIRNIKKVLEILPIKKAKNRNCIKNIKNFGYRLII